MDIKEYMKIRDRLEEYIKETQVEGVYSNMLPTIRDLARRYKVRQDDIIDMVEDCETLDLIVGHQIPGTGYSTFDTNGDFKVEYVGEI